MTSTAAQPLALSYDEAARLLSVSERSVRRLVAQGELPVLRVGHSPRIRPEDLRAYVDAQRGQEPA